jgi:ribosomal protein S18 acetylase RimI-like enzyme
MTTTVRVGNVGDAEALATLRWRRATQDRGYDGDNQAEFVAALRDWMVAHADTHIPFVAERDDAVVGMAWLMVGARVPTAERYERRYGDVQSVFVIPELRNDGIGALLIDMLLKTADEKGLEHVTVHSSERAVAFYRRHGFGYQDVSLIRA